MNIPVIKNTLNMQYSHTILKINGDKSVSHICTGLDINNKKWQYIRTTYFIDGKRSSVALSDFIEIK